MAITLRENGDLHWRLRVVMNKKIDSRDRFFPASPPGVAHGDSPDEELS